MVKNCCNCSWYENGICHNPDAEISRKDGARRRLYALGRRMTQLSLFPEEQKAQRRADIDRTIDKIRAKYGYFSIRRAITLVDPALDLDAKGGATRS